MDLLKDRIRPTYFRYLSAAFGSALISSIYSAVDMAMVGQYHGSDGTAALAVVAPLWNVLYSLGLLFGIGGSVLFSSIRGKDRDEESIRKSNVYFTVSFIGVVIFSLLNWLLLLFLEEPLLRLFGATDELMPLAKRYLYPVLFAVPSFLLTQFLAAYLRNDSDPGLATFAVLFGGIFNVFGDYFFVFTLDMGIMGAGLATVVGSVLSLLLMLIHFLKKKNTLRFLRPSGFFSKSGEIISTGFSTFFVDVAMGILTILFNNQISRYLGKDALSVYGVIINISTFVQCCAYSVGQASQPIISVNYGANESGRIKEVLKYSLLTCLAFGVIWVTLCESIPNGLIYIFMNPNEEVLKIAPDIIRCYSISFILLPFNIFSTYYFQALLKPKTAFIVSVSRGVLISGALIFLLPLISPSMIWFSMPITELIVFLFAYFRLYRETRKLKSLPSEH